jgi:hypothetical protein
MRLLLFTLVPAVLIGLAAGGRIGNIAETRFRWPLAGLAGIVLQFLPVKGALGSVVLTLSFVLLFVAAGVNWRLPGFVLILVGLWLNFVVITVNEGMPVTARAVVASGQADTLDDFAKLDSPKHHLANDQDQLLFLGDVIAIGAPVDRAVSVGDLFAYGGAMWFIVASMRRRRPVEATVEATAEPTSAEPVEPAGGTDLSAAEAS